MRIKDFEFLSIWEIAHRWEGVNPEEVAGSGLSSKVRERMRDLIKATTESLNPYDAHGELLVMEVLRFGFKKSPVAKQLDHALHDPSAHREFLKSIYLSQYEVRKVWPAWESLPAFWFEKWEIEEADRWAGVNTEITVGRPPKLRPDQEDKAKCQLIAVGLWAKHPDMTIADMAKCPEILIEGNGKAYKGKNTLRNWLKEVAPASVRNRRGRPKKQKPPSNPV